MAVVSVAFDGTRIDAADALGTLWQDLAGGKTQQEPDFLYQRSSGTDGAISEKVGTSEGGVKYYNSGSSTAFSTNSKSWLAKHIATNKNALNNQGSTGGILELGSGDRANYYRYYAVGGDTYVKRGGFLITPINPNIAAWRDAVVGSPNLGAVDNFNWACTFGGTSKAENVAMDAIDVIDNGTGLTLTGGDGASADGTFDDYVTIDEGTLANSWGVVSTFLGTPESGIAVNGTITIGGATATVFNDSNKTIIYPAKRVAAGFSGLKIGMSNVSNDINFEDITFQGLGQDNRKQFFDTTSSVNGTTEVITTEDPHEFLDGDAVLYSKEGGSAAIGLTDATEYFVNAISATTLSLHTSRQNAISDTSRVNLTASGTENHSLTRTPDTRADYTVTGTTGVGHAPSDCKVLNHRLVTLTSKATLTGFKFVGTGKIQLGGGTLTGCIFSAGTQHEGNESDGWHSQVRTDTLANISNCTFNRGDIGHAVHLTANTGSPFTYAGNKHNGYWAPATNGWKFHTTNGVNGTTEVITTDAAHGHTTGDAVWYNKEGGTAAIGLTDGAKYYVNVLSPTTFSVHRSKNNANADTNRINLTAAGTETHSFYSNNAALFNDSGGAVTVTVTAGGDSPSVRNGSGASTTVTNAKTLTLAPLLTNSEVRIFEAGTTTELDGVENSGTSFAYNYDGVDAGNSVDIRILNVNRKDFVKKAHVLASVDESVFVTQPIDRAVFNPP